MLKIVTDFLGFMNICKTSLIYAIFADYTRTISRNPGIDLLQEFLKCFKIFDISRKNIPYFQTKTL